MLGLVALFYLLLCTRVSFRLRAAVSGGKEQRNSALSCLGFRLTLPIGKRRGDQGEASLRRKLLKMKRSAAYLNRLLPFEQGAVYLRLGLEDAAQTAVAAGLCGAALQAVSALPACRGRCAVRVVPDYSRTGVQLYAQGIFSAFAGDIMAAALKTALMEGRKRIQHRSGVKADGKASH